jgi:hypothetical protein
MMGERSLIPEFLYEALPAGLVFDQDLIGLPLLGQPSHAFFQFGNSTRPRQNQSKKYALPVTPQTVQTE